MKLRILSPPSWSISRNLITWSRKLDISLAGPEEIGDMIVIADGSPDDIVYLILAHKLDGGKAVGITATQEKRVASIPLALELVRREKLEKLLIALDQEADELAELWRQIEEKLREKADEYKLDASEERFRLYSCQYAQHRFKALIAINGLNTSYSKHTIEDHLIKFAGKSLGDDVRAILKSSSDPKEAWRKLRDHHQIILLKIRDASVNQLEEFFPQQIKALRELK